MACWVTRMRSVIHGNALRASPARVASKSGWPSLQRDPPQPALSGTLVSAPTFACLIHSGLMSLDVAGPCRPWHPPTKSSARRWSSPATPVPDNRRPHEERGAARSSIDGAVQRRHGLGPVVRSGCLAGQRGLDGRGRVRPAPSGAGLRRAVGARRPAAHGPSRWTRDAAPAQAVRGTAGPWRCAQAHIATPATIMGTQSHWPMLMPSDRMPRKASGSRKYSAMKRNTP